MKYRLPVVLVLAVMAVGWLWLCPAPWIKSLPPPAPYPSLSPDADPSLVRAALLPALVGYQSPKPVVAADDNGHVVIVAHAVVNRPLGSDLVAWRSVDWGKSWASPENLTQQASQGELNFDPWLETDGQGHYYFVHALASDGRPLIRRSEDAGQTWSDAAPIPWRHCDRPVLGISSQGRQLVVAAAMSERAANASTQPLDSNDPDLAVKLRSSVHFSAGVFVSADHGDSWARWQSPFGDNEHAIPFAVVVDDNQRVAAAWIVEGSGSRSSVSVSQDCGRTWTTTTLVESLQPDRPHAFNGCRFPVLALDGAGGLHVAYVTAGGKGLMVRRSLDWELWNNPLLLASPAAEEVRMSAIDARGPMVHVTWFERIGMTWHAYYRGSRDSGATWSAPLCLSESIQQSDVSLASGFQMFGDDDQSSVGDDGRGRVHAVWCVRGGSIVHAIVDWSFNKDGSF